MRRIIRISTLVIIFLFINLYGMILLNEWKTEKGQSPLVTSPTKKITENDEEKTDKKIKDSILGLMGVKTEKIINKFDKPIRIDQSAYGYEWWIYNHSNQYFQVGIEGDKVVSMIVIGDEINTEPFKLGQRYEELYSQDLPSQEIKFEYSGNSYEFMLSEEDIFERPLFKIGDVWVQLYFDKVTHLLSSVRLMNTEVLLRQRPYELRYTGELPVVLIDEEQEKLIEDSTEKQIFDISNIIRQRFALSVFKWNEEVSHMAYMHSEDMNNTGFFDHVSPVNGNLENRLKKSSISYSLAGENIAHNYIDALAAVEGWMNSEGHRVNLLNNEFKQLGVGVDNDYYTQNFLTP